MQRQYRIVGQTIISCKREYDAIFDAVDASIIGAHPHGTLRIFLHHGNEITGEALLGVISGKSAIFELGNPFSGSYPEISFAVRV